MWLSVPVLSTSLVPGPEDGFAELTDATGKPAVEWEGLASELSSLPGLPTELLQRCPADRGLSSYPSL